MCDPKHDPQAPDEREKNLVRKIGFVCTAIVRGKQAKRSKSVIFYRWNILLNVVLYVLGGAGVVQISPNNSTSSGSTHLLGLGSGALGLAIVLELYKRFGIEQGAISALAAYDAFVVIELNLNEAVQQDGDPTDQINVVLKDSNTLLRNFIKALPPDNENIYTMANALRDAVLEKRLNWTIPRGPSSRSGGVTL